MTTKMSIMDPDNQSSNHFDMFSGAVFDSTNPETWGQPISSQSPTPVNAASQPWDLQKEVAQGYHNYTLPPSQQFNISPYTSNSLQPSYTQYASAPYHNQPDTVNMASLSYSNAMPTSMNINQQDIVNYQTYTNSQHNQPSTSMYSASPSLANQARQVMGISPGVVAPASTFDTSIAPATFDEIPDVPKGQRSSTDAQFTLIDIVSMMQKTNSKPLSRYVTLSSKPLELPISKAATVPKFDIRHSIRKVRQLGGFDAEFKSKIDKVEKKARRKSGASGPISGIRVPTAGSKASPSPSTDLSSDSDSDYSDEEDEPSPLPATRPADQVKALDYDVMKAVWFPRNKYIPNDVLIARIALFSELFINLRDQWKKANELVKQAVEAKQNSQLPGLKSKTQKHRQLIESTINTAIKYGYPEILTVLGENRKMLASFQQLLVDRATEKDYSGQLTLAILQFLGCMRTVTAEVLDVTKLSKVLTHFGKKGNEEIKAAVKKINHNAGIKEAAPAKKALSDFTIKTELKPVSSNAKINSAIKTEPKIPDVKGRSDSTMDAIAAPKKRLATESSGAPTAKRQTVIPPKRPLATLGSRSSANVSSSLVTKPKAAPTTKSSTFFSNMQSATKKPTSSVASTSAATTSAPARPAFSFGGLVDGLLKDKSTEIKSKPDEKKPVETESDKAKRLRKEARRKLRVSWKADDELVAVRLFTHELDEDTGYDVSSLRDAGDILNEGKAFKEGFKHTEPLAEDDLDDEQQSEEVIVESFGDESSYRVSSIDEDSIALADRDKNYVKFLGPLVPDSPEREIQQEREMNTLMALYVKRSDIPPRPRSPINPYPGLSVDAIPMGPPIEETWKRLAKIQPTSIPVLPDSSSAVPDFSAILSSLIPSVAPVVAPTQNQDWTTVLEGFPKQSNTPVPTSTSAFQYAQATTVTPSGMQNPLLSVAQALAPATNAAESAATAPNQDLQAILAALATINQAPPPQSYTQPQQQAQAHQAHPFLQAQQAPSAVPTMTPETQSLLAQLGLAQPGLAQPNFAGFPGISQQQQAPAPEVNFNPWYDQQDRKRSRDDEDEGRNDEYKRQNMNASARGGRNAPVTSKPAWKAEKPKWPEGSVAPNAYTLPCKFWPEGKCRKGDKCTYRHDNLT